MPVNVKEVKRRLDFLLKDENLVSDYIRRFGPVINMKNIKEIKTSNISLETSGDSADSAAGNDPVFETKLNCPVCNNENITGYELKAKSQQQIENKLTQIEYIGALGHKTVDYDQLSVTVCPRCLFASPDKKDFITVSTFSGKVTPSSITQNAILTLQEKIGERKGTIEGIADIDNFFQRPRNLDAVIASYKLAILRGQTEVYHEQVNALFKIGAYHLKVAKFKKAKGEDEEASLRDALDCFSECFKTSNTSTETLEYRTIYMIIVLHIRLKEQKKAHPYIGVLDKIKTDLKIEEKSGKRVVFTVIDQWLSKAKLLWEDKDLDDLFA